MRIIIARSCVCAALFVLVAASLSGCGDSGGGDGSCDPATDDACVCETEGGGFCDDPDDLDCFCFLDDGGNNGGNNGATDQATVNIADFAFSPTNVTVNAGGQVTWINNDQAQHTITFDNGSIDELLNNGGSFTATFNTVGTFSYHDRLNNQPGLRGTVVVQ